jgi:hypothetical protein
MVGWYARTCIKCRSYFAYSDLGEISRRILSTFRHLYEGLRTASRNFRISRTVTGIRAVCLPNASPLSSPVQFLAPITRRKVGLINLTVAVFLTFGVVHVNVRNCRKLVCVLSQTIKNLRFFFYGLRILGSDPELILRRSILSTE